MRRICYSVAMSLDGYVAGPGGEADWIIMDPEIDFGALVNRFDTMLLGRRTFEMFAPAWSNRTAEEDPGAPFMNESPKYVVSGTLERADWTMQRERPAFLTWMALSWQARPGVVRRQIEARRKFLESELEREEETVRAVLDEVGHSYHEAVWMLRLVIEQFKTELRWLENLEQELPKRGRARKPEYAKE